MQKAHDAHNITVLTEERTRSTGFTSRFRLQDCTALIGVSYPPNLECEKFSRANADLPGFKNKHYGSRRGLESVRLKRQALNAMCENF